LRPIRRAISGSVNWCQIDRLTEKDRARPGRVLPVITSIIVVLPAPLGPMITQLPSSMVGTACWRLQAVEADRYVVEIENRAVRHRFPQFWATQIPDSANAPDTPNQMPRSGLGPTSKVAKSLGLGFRPALTSPRGRNSVTRMNSSPGRTARIGECLREPAPRAVTMNAAIGPISVPRPPTAAYIRDLDRAAAHSLD
jgi:hypothetical protein